MAPSLTEILFALGLDDKVVAVSNGSDYPPEALQIKKIGTFWEPDIEAVIASKPDLVVTLGFGRHMDFARRLERIGYGCLAVEIEKVDELFEGIDEIGKATGAGVEAQKLVEDMRKRMTLISSRIEQYEKVRVLYVVQRDPLRVAGRDTFINEMIELAGGENAIGATVHKYPPIGAEQLIVCGAEVIIEPLMGGGDIAVARKVALEFWNRYQEVPAVREDRIYVIDGDAVSRLGPRLPDAIDKMAACLRPGLFAE
jgi:iron complex transport system substrate-binding protein